MSWFERYGIPGTYFVGLMVGWIYALCPQIISSCPEFIQWNNIDSSAAVLALIAISLPIGYVISIIGQFVYLNWRRCFWECEWLRGWLGFHGAAMDRLRPFAGDDLTQDEAIIEALSTLDAVLPANVMPHKGHEYVRDWIRRRMDVMAINVSLIVATVSALIIAFGIFLFLGRLSLAPIILFVISIAIIAAMICSMSKLRQQIIEIIFGEFQYTGFHNRFTSLHTQ